MDYYYDIKDDPGTELYFLDSNDDNDDNDDKKKDAKKEDDQIKKKGR